VFVEGLSEVAVSNVGEASEAVVRGLRARTTAATMANRESSRSHSVFSLQLESAEKVGATTTCRSSRFHLIDLAGSERQKATGAAGERLKEACGINKSLSCLTSVIHALVDIAQGKQRFVPYRDSKLTMLLRDSLGGNSKTCVVANVSPGDDCLAETLSTLKFAQRAKLVKNTPMVNEDTQGSIAALAAELKATKAQLSEWKALAMTTGAEGGGAGRVSNGKGDSGGKFSLGSTLQPSSEAYKLGEGLLASWDSLLRESLQGSRAISGTTVNGGQSLEGGLMADPVLALTALGHISKKLQGLLGDNINNNCSNKQPIPLTLEASAAAYERLRELEERHATAWAAKEEADITAGDLENSLDAMRAEKSLIEKQVQQLKGVVAAVAAEWETIKTSIPLSTGTCQDSSASSMPSNSVSSNTTQVELAGGGSSKLLAPGFFAGGRRASVVSVDSAISSQFTGTTANLSATLSNSNKSNSNITTTTSVASSQRSTASSMCKSTFAGAAAASSAPSMMRRGSISSTGPLASNPTAVRRGSVSMASGSALSGVVPFSAIKAQPSTSTGTWDDALHHRSDLAVLLSGYATATNSALEAALESRNSEISRLKEKVARLEALPPAVGAGADETVSISRAAFHGLREELSRVTWELSSLRRQVFEKCEPSIGEKAKAAFLAEQSDWESKRLELEEKIVAMESVCADSRREVEEAHERASEAAAGQAALEAELEEAAELKRGLENRVKDLCSEKNRAEAELGALRSTIGEGLREREALKNRLIVEQASGASSEERFSNLSEECFRLKKALGASEERMCALRTQLESEKSNVVATFEEKVGGLHNTISLLEKKLNAQSEDTAALREELASAVRAKWAAEEECGRYEGAMKEGERGWEEEARRWEVRLIEAEGKASASEISLGNTILSLRSDLASFMTRLADSQDLLKSAEIRAEKAESLAASLEISEKRAREEMEKNKAETAVAIAAQLATPTPSVLVTASQGSSTGTDAIMNRMNKALGLLVGVGDTQVVGSTCSASVVKPVTNAEWGVVKATPVSLAPTTIEPLDNVECSKSIVSHVAAASTTTTTSAAAAAAKNNIILATIAPVSSIIIQPATVPIIGARPRLAGAGLVAVTTTKAVPSNRAPLGSADPNSALSSTDISNATTPSCIGGEKSNTSTTLRTCLARPSPWALANFALKGESRGFYC